MRLRTALLGFGVATGIRLLSEGKLGERVEVFHQLKGTATEARQTPSIPFGTQVVMRGVSAMFWLSTLRAMHVSIILLLGSSSHMWSSSDFFSVASSSLNEWKCFPLWKSTRSTGFSLRSSVLTTWAVMSSSVCSELSNGMLRFSWGKCSTGMTSLAGSDCLASKGPYDTSILLGWVGPSMASLSLSSGFTSLLWSKDPLNEWIDRNFDKCCCCCLARPKLCWKKNPELELSKWRSMACTKPREQHPEIKPIHMINRHI